MKELLFLLCFLVLAQIGNETYDYLYPAAKNKKNIIDAVKKGDRDTIVGIYPEINIKSYPAKQEFTGFIELITHDWPPVKAAIFHQKTTSLDALLEAGHDINQAYEACGATPLHYAIVRRENMVDKLIIRGATIAESHVRLAAGLCRVRLLDKWLEAGLTIPKGTIEYVLRAYEYKDREMFNYKMPSLKDRLETIEILIKYGAVEEADVIAGLEFDFLPITKALFHKHQVLTPRILSNAAYKGDLKLVEYFAENATNKHALNNLVSSSGCLLSAASSDSVYAAEIIELVIKWGAGLDETDSEGNTALMRAIKIKNSRAILVLLQAGANPDIENDSGLTPRHAFHASIREAEKKHETIALASNIFNRLEE